MSPGRGSGAGLNLKRPLEGNAIDVREALRRYFVDGRIVVTPTAEGYYVAEGRFLPLVALTDRTLETTKPLSGGLPIENISSCAGAQRGLFTAISLGFERWLVA